MALLKDLIVQGASRFIGDAYFATIKAGVWNGTPIDLSHGGTALTSGTQTAGKILKSTATNGVSEWVAQSSLSVGSASRLSGTSSYTAWGKTYWSNGVPSTISGDMTSVGNITPSANGSKDCGSSSNAWLNVYGNNIVSNTTLYLTSAASTIFKPQGTERARFNTSGNLIIGLTSSTTPVANDITDLKLYVSGATTITGTLTLSKTQDLAGTVNNSPALIIGGSATGVHMEIDSNEIHAKATGTTVAPLYLNNEGGLVYARGCVVAEQSSPVTTAGKIFVSTTTEGRGEWYTGVTIAQLKSVSDWYDTVKDTDTDANINRWNEIVDFLNNFTEADTLASVLSTYVTLGTAQTITGAKTFANPISGNLLGNATTADRLKSTTAVGGAGTPVYFTGGLPVACTAANVRTFLGLGTSYNKNINSSTTGYAAYYSAGSTISGSSLLQFDTTNSIVTIKSTEYAALEIWRANNNFSAIRYCNGETTKTGLGYIGFPSSGTTSVAVGRPYWSTDGSPKIYYQLVHSTAKTAIGASGTPVYIDNNGQVLSCDTGDIRTALGLGTVYSHAHTDYITGITYTSGTRVLSWTKGGAANGSVTFGSNAFESYTLSGVSGRTVSSSTVGYAAYYSAASTVSGTSILTFGTNVAAFGSSSTNVTITGYGKLTVTKSGELGPIEVYRTDGNYAVGLSCYSGTTKTLNGILGIGGSASTGVATNKPFWTPDQSTYYQLAYSTAKTAVGGTGTPVYVDANGQIQTCTAFSSASVSYAASSGQVKTVTRSTNATHYLTFVDSDNSTATAESIYTDAGITYNPSTNLLTVQKLTATSTVALSGATTIDSLTAGSLIVTGASSLTGNVSMGTVTAGTWNGSVIDVAHGGTGCSTLTSGSALIGNGTGAVTFRSIDNTTTVGSLMNVTTWAASTNLVTRNAIAYWDGRYQTTSNASNLAYCNKGAFGTATTRTYATAISTASGTTSATVNNYNSDSYVPTNKAVYNYVTSTLGVAATIEKTSITKSLNSSTWTETGYTLYGESQGSYMLQITDTTTAAVFTGVFSVYHSSSATGNDLDEIPLHMCASATNKVRIYAATLNGKLLVSSQNTSATNHTLTIKYKKIL